MHNKMFFILKRIVCVVLLVISFNGLAAQDYIGFSKKDILLIKGNNYSENTDSYLKYNFPKIIFMGDRIDPGFEAFKFDENQEVILYTKFGLFKEDVLLKIIKDNNSNFKRVDIGDKQDSFQWIDSERKLDITLKAKPMEEYFFITYLIVKIQF